MDPNKIRMIKNTKPSRSTAQLQINHTYEAGDIFSPKAVQLRHATDIFYEM